MYQGYVPTECCATNFQNETKRQRRTRRRGSLDGSRKFVAAASGPPVAGTEVGSEGVEGH
eukprot:1441877-Pyramimonas_sp.AAC.1